MFSKVTSALRYPRGVSPVKLVPPHIRLVAHIVTAVNEREDTVWTEFILDS